MKVARLPQLLLVAMVSFACACLICVQSAYAAETHEVNSDDINTVIAGAGEGDTIKLTEEVTADVVIPEGKTIILDLNGQKLTNKTSTHTITNNGNLTIIGSGTVDNVTHGKAALYNTSIGEATLNGGVYERSKEAGTISGNGGNSWYTIYNEGKITINDGSSVKNSGSYSSMICNKGGNLIINGGQLSGGLNNVKNESGGEGTLTVNGGSFQSSGQAAILNWNIATINNGTFTVGENASDAPVILSGNWTDNPLSNSVTTINGGVFNPGPSGIVLGGFLYDGGYYGGNVKINGGTLNGDIDLQNTNNGINPSLSIADSDKGYPTIKGSVEVDGNVSPDIAGGLFYKPLNPSYLSEDSVIFFDGESYGVCSSVDEAIEAGAKYKVGKYFFDQEDEAQKFFENNPDLVGNEEVVQIRCTVTFDDCIESTDNESYSVKTGEQVTKPADPTLEGYKFLGWYEYDFETKTYAAEPFDFSTPITEDMTLYAQWEEVVSDNASEQDPGTNKENDESSEAKQNLPETGDDLGLAITLLAGLSVVAAGAIIVARRKLS